MFVNGMFPHILSSIFGDKLIHITTDCVFNGTEGAPYDENSPHSYTDIYGSSKSLGEPKHSITLRTSIIGRETHGYTGLLEWFLEQKGKTVKGYTEHYWNGITTTQFGKLCDFLMEWNPVRPGIYHIFGETVSKYQMLCAFKEKYKVDCEIVPDNSTKLNRTLSTVKDLNYCAKIPSFAKMLEEMP
jgi:dTDP-4-dehydrorhamnose reductase